MNSSFSMLRYTALFQGVLGQTSICINATTMMFPS